MEGQIKRNQKRAFTLVEVLIDVFVVTIIFGALVASFISVIKVTQSSRVRSLGLALANERVEELRNMSYDSLATVNGSILPAGDIKDSEIVTKSGVSFNLVTRIIYVDDPSDGCAIGSGPYICYPDNQTSDQFDSAPYDYKRAHVEVTQENSNLVLAKVDTDIAAKAAETPTSTGMILVIVNDSRGQPVTNAFVTITSELYPNPITGYTNTQGYFFVSGLTPNSHNKYHITATKDGFSTDYTTEKTPQNPNQNNPDVNVLAQQVTTQTLQIDLMSHIIAHVTDENNNPVPNINLSAIGDKITCFNPKTPKNTYAAVTNSLGIANFNSVEWDSYTIQPPSGWHILTTSPYQKIDIDPNITKDIYLTMSTDSSWPEISEVVPIASPTNSTVEVTINGSNFSNGASVVLRQAGQTDISSSVISSNNNTIVASFNLNNAGLGAWDIVLTNNAKTTIQKEGFIVTP